MEVYITINVQKDIIQILMGKLDVKHALKVIIIVILVKVFAPIPLQVITQMIIKIIFTNAQ
jgi:hypothetical protein